MSRSLQISGTARSIFWSGAKRRLLKEAAGVLFRKPFAIKTTLPLVSFTFDDFPRSAFLEASPILGRYGLLGTYYVSLGLLGKQSPLGAMFEAEDLIELSRLGHELGCHTFSHCHSWNTPPEVYEGAILKNRQALAAMLPGLSFQTFAYPISAPRPGVKKVAGKHFLCCRGGGRRRINAGEVDLNLLSVNFLEKSRADAAAIKAVIEQNAHARGWLIFATHDVCERPSPFGCTPKVFEQALNWALGSGSRILPVLEALNALRAMSGSMNPSHD
jgi:peptidoglycan/xylan/chitin deacetylase (PgdA/CDA1 family)